MDELLSFMNEKAAQYNRPEFIEGDPICVPHAYAKKQDIEIAALFASLLAWGRRNTIIDKSKELLRLMDNTPHDFILHHALQDLKHIEKFRHRTFSGLDALYFIRFLKSYYTQNTSLETAFIVENKAPNIEAGLIRFHRMFFSLEDPLLRTRKHVATPERHSACKRMNMFLRWMVRRDKKGVDFGLWRKISPSQLVAPCDVHVERTARILRLITRKQMDWRTALELTANLKRFDPKDPVKYDFALFGLGIEKFFNPHITSTL